MKKRVVITGIGPVTSLGIGVRPFFENLLALKTAIRPIPVEYERHAIFKSRFYVPFPAFSLGDYVKTRFDSLMEKPAKAALVGAKLALLDAALEPPEETTVILGIGMGALQTAFQSHLAHVTNDSSHRFNRMVIPMQMPNAASAWVSILLGLKGPNFTVNASCASGTLAIGEAFSRIAAGVCETALAGGVECLEDESGSTMRGFDATGALTRSEDGWPRPFSKQRSGFLFADGGGCVLVLEELSRARRRGARIYAEIGGYVVNSDAHSILQLEESGAQIKTLLRSLKGNETIDYLNAHGTGTLNNDQVEAQAIQEVFGDHEKQPLINSTKGLLGHTIGASGAIEAAVTALTISEEKIHGNITSDPLENLRLVGATTETPVHAALSLSFGFGGHNVGLLLKKVSGERETP